MTDVYIHYKTNDDQVSVSWLKASQTDSKVRDYLFTQCESIACRSIAPLQDSPSNKITWNAEIVVDYGYQVYMSANQTKNETNADKSKSTFGYNCTIPVQSYLIAMAVGNLVKVPTAPYNGNEQRTYVISEPTMVDDYALELSDLDHWLT